MVSAVELVLLATITSAGPSPDANDKFVISKSDSL